MIAALIETAAMLAIATSNAGFAQNSGPVPLQDGDGNRWTATSNDHGAVLRSARETIYLGRGCDARSRTYGRGRWEWANGGVLIVFSGRRIGFPRQEIDAGQGERCRS